MAKVGRSVNEMSLQAEHKEGKHEAGQEQRLGRALVFLQPLSYLLDVEEEAPIIDVQGQEIGKLQVAIKVELVGNEVVAKLEKMPSTKAVPKDGEAPVQQWEGVDFAKYLGQPLLMSLSVTRAHALNMGGSPEHLEVRCYTDLAARKTAAGPVLRIPRDATVPDPDSTVAVALNFSKQYELKLTEDLQTWFAAEALEFEVWNTRPSFDPSDRIGGAGQQVKILALQAERDKLKAEVTDLRKSKACALL